MNKYLNNNQMRKILMNQDVCSLLAYYIELPSQDFRSLIITSKGNEALICIVLKRILGDKLLCENSKSSSLITIFTHMRLKQYEERIQRTKSMLIALQQKHNEMGRNAVFNNRLRKATHKFHNKLYPPFDSDIIMNDIVTPTCLNLIKYMRKLYPSRTVLRIADTKRSVQYLLDNGLKDMNVILQNGNNILFYVHRLKQIKFLLKKRKGVIPPNINQRNNKDQTPLSIAIKRNDLSHVRFLIKQGAEIFHKTHGSVLNNVHSYAMLKYILDVSKKIIPRHYKKNSQHVKRFVHHNNYKCVVLLLQQGFSPNAKDCKNKNTAFFALNAKMLKILIHYNVNLMQKDNLGRLAIQHFMSKYNYACVNILLKQHGLLHKDVLLDFINRDFRPFNCKQIERTKRLRILQLLKKYGQNLNVTDGCGKNILFYINDIKTIRILNTWGVRLDVKDIFKQNLLFYANTPVFLNYLLNEGLSSTINSCNISNNTPIEHAAIENHFDVVKYLLDREDVIIRDKLIKIIIQKNHRSMIDYLLRTTSSTWPCSTILASTSRPGSN